MEERVTDQLRKLTNKVTLSGLLTQLSEMRTGTNKNGVDYISFNGAIKCEPGKNTKDVKFEVFANAKTAKGADSKTYAAMKKWYSTAVPDIKDPGHGTMVSMTGSVEDRPYVNSKGELIEDVRFRMTYINTFEEYGARMDLEGFIAQIYDEEIGKNEEKTFTGRQCMRLITKDYSNLVSFRKIIIPAELVEPMQAAGYEQGATALFYIKITTGSNSNATAGGIGEVPKAEFLRREYVMTGAAPVIEADSERAIPKKLMEKALNERNTRLAAILAEGYKGKGETQTAAIGTMGGIGSPVHEPILDDAEDDDMPF